MNAVERHGTRSISVLELALRSPITVLLLVEYMLHMALLKVFWRQPDTS